MVANDMDKYDLTHNGDDWSLKKQGAERASKVFKGETKAESLKGVSEFMEKNPGSVRIHKEKGGIQEERTYPRSADPRKSKG